MDLGRVLRIARRRFPYAFAVLLTIVLVTVAVVEALPPVYRSMGRVAVESQQIPPELVPSTVTGSAQARIGAIQQAVMTDARVAAILADLEPYPERRGEPLGPVIERFRRNVSIEALQDPYDSGAGTIAFTVAYDHTDPQVARAVATELVDLFLEENARTRSTRASETTEFLRREAERLSERAREMDRRVADYKQRHSDLLPEHLDLRVDMLGRAQSELNEVQRELAAARQEERFLETQKGAFAALLARRTEADPALMTPAERLLMLEGQLARASMSYTEAHPEIKRLRRQIATARQAAAADDGTASRAAGDPQIAEIEARIAAVGTRIGSLTSEREELKQKIDTLATQIVRTPEVELGLRELAFGYESALREYEEVRAKQQQAELAENLEVQRMAERFVLLEPPFMPFEPVRPKRLKLIAMGVFLAVAGAVVAALLLERLDPRIRDIQELRQVLGERPLAAIPVIATPRDTRRRTALAALGAAAYAASVLVGVLLVGLLAEPLRSTIGSFYP